MNREEATALLDAELEMTRKQSYEDLALRLSEPAVCFERAGPSGTIYQIQIECFRDDRAGGNIRVVGCVDDGGWLAYLPLTRDFIKAPGWFVRWRVTRPGQASAVGCQLVTPRRARG